MRISDLIASCFRSLLRRKVRTLLTIIGVVIGTCAIVVTISLGEGMNRSQMEMISQWTDLTTIQVYRKWSGGDSESIAKLDDAAVSSFNALKHVTASSPIMELYNVATVSAGKYEYTGSLRAVNLKIFKEMGYELTAGSFETGAETTNAVYFGSETVFNFTDTTHPDRWTNYEYDENGNIISDPPFDPATTTLKYKLVVQDDNGGMSYVSYAGGWADSVIADPGQNGSDEDEEQRQAELEARRASVEEKKLTYGGTLKGDYSKDDGNTVWSMYIDIELAKQLKKEYNKLNNITETDENGKKTDPNYITYDQVTVKVDDMNNVDEVQQAIEDMGYSTYSFESQRKPLEEQTRQIQLLFGGLGMISMLVAAIGIANTMVMSIYERTREIGVMKVLGCDLNNIRMMFLIEAGMIGTAGGVIGVGLSFAISGIINAFSSGDSYTSIIPVWLVLLGLGFSLLVGVISGFSPANRAVKISALSAIRQEG